MIATIANMKACQEGGVRVVAYSRETGEQYSATPGDYWSMADTDFLTDSLGEPMILAHESVSMIEVEL